MKNWEDAINQIVANPGTVMVLGATDTGKSTFCLDLLRAGMDARVECAFVDADVGQSDLGPPCAVSMGLVTEKPEGLSDIKLRRLAFVGSTTPTGHFLECVNGTKQLIDSAKKLGAKLIVVNTTGMTEGYPARKLKTNKTDAVRPDYLVGLQRSFETDHLLLPFARMPDIQIIRIKTPDYISRKSPEYRAAKRKLKFSSEFSGAMGHIVHLDSVSLWGTAFRAGRPLTWQYTKAMEDTISCRILHAEVTGRTVFAVTEQDCALNMSRLLEEKYPNYEIVLASSECFNNLLCGLADHNARTMQLGLVQAVDFKRMFMFVLSGIRSISPVSIVQMGSIRLTREGREIARLRPGEI